LQPFQQHIFICTNQKSADKVCCANTGGSTYFLYLKERLRQLGLHGLGKIRVSQSGCLGRCDLGPCMVIYPEGVWYTYRSIEDIDRIIDEYLIKHEVVVDLLMQTFDKT